MSSARELLRAANKANRESNNNNIKTLTSSIINDFNNHEEVEEKRDIEKEIEAIAETIPEPETVNSGSKKDEAKEEAKPKKAGRPPVYTETLKTVTVRLTKANYDFAKRNGWEFGGYTGYINHLIEEKRGIEK